MATCCGSTKAPSVPTNTTSWSKPRQALADGADKTYVFQNIGDGRAAAFLPARSPLNDLLGIAMIIADAKFLDSKGAAKFVTPTTTNLMRRLAFLRRPTPAPSAAPPPAPAPAPAAKVASPAARPPMAPPPGAQPPARPAAPPPGVRPGAPQAAAPAQRPAAPPPARAAAPAAAARPPAAAAPSAPARPAAPPPKAAQPAARPAAPPARPAPPTKPGAQQQRPAGNADSDSIAFEISNIDPRALLKQPARTAAPEPKRPDLRVIQTDRLPKLELSLESDAIPQLIQDEAPSVDELVDAVGDVAAEEVTTEVEALGEQELEAEGDMTVAPEFVDEAPQISAGAGQFEYYGQIFELHVQQLVKLKGSGGTKRYEVLVRDAHADNEFGVAPDRVVQDVHDPSANSDLDRIVVEQLVIWMSENRGIWESEPASFSVNVGMGTIADPKFASFVAATLKNHKVPAKSLGFEISEKSCVDQVRDVDLFVQACEKIGCHVVLDDFTMHHNSLRWLGSPALKFLKLDPKITAVAMKDRVPQALVVAIAQASKVLGLSCVAKRVDTPAVRDWLSAVGLDYAQGFLLDQPRSLVSLGAQPQK